VLALSAQAATVIYVARTVPPHVNGDLAVAVALLALVDVLTGAGLPQVLAPALAADREARAPLRRLVGLRLGLALGLFLAAQGAAAWLTVPSLARFVRVTSVAWFGVALDLDWFFVARGRIPLSAASRAFTALARLACVVAMVRGPEDAPQLPVAWALSVFVGAAGAWMLAASRGMLRSAPGAASIELWPGRESWAFLAGELSVYAFTQGDRLLVYALAGAEATGLYHAAQRLVQPVLSVSAVVTATLYHELSSAYAAARAAAVPAESGALGAALARYFRLMLYATLPLGAFTLLFAPTLTGWAYGSAYAGTAPVLALCGLVVSANHVAGAYVLPLKTWGLATGYSRAVMLTCLAHVAGCLLLVPALGARGAALSALLAMAAATAAGRAAFRSAVRFPAGLAILRPAGSALLAAGAAMSTWWAGPLPAISAFAIVYITADLIVPWPRRRAARA
jgi:O-antigen/teichoic acid export membrane protein